MHSNQEKKIISQLIQEISLFLMHHEYKSYHIEFNQDDFQEIFTITVDHIEDELLDFMKTKIKQEREQEIEAYYWELLGDIDSSSELKIMGLFIDDMEVMQTKSSVTIKLYRNRV
ncbi:MAG: hypothetical protein A2Y45_05655 [Tenericutes bacterium GWC2_34_14]|nr:MAG: hypothetical protein A2Z84_05590 [Tenericutes bacterium GWA2_35_7]OHE28439.1 MAG: hypothetical protein A2Y45_05655 [Tenericutes bacterium GWC2_34_14]OHE33653.1 MAG: hypothetical protein A2012_04155 [Tenericutes bacterium GWE2_34_108]OHE36938.1 MAG: hypothetical protein A2Y46_09955 [Tenericutes bacterium GWF1_35_14]OHE37982.1 MAG: hypothetical protein A2Y44_08710 [Tenericutes bacterium GWF2_35_184]OHE42051.1 MAG: hypothetical protein A3K26_09525 [Tenericutes bacterium RIFOXYA12_FULL_35_